MKISFPSLKNIKPSGNSAMAPIEGPYKWSGVLVEILPGRNNPNTNVLHLSMRLSEYGGSVEDYQFDGYNTTAYLVVPDGTVLDEIDRLLKAKTKDALAEAARLQRGWDAMLSNWAALFASAGRTDILESDDFDIDLDDVAEYTGGCWFIPSEPLTPEQQAANATARMNLAKEPHAPSFWKIVFLTPERYVQACEGQFTPAAASKPKVDKPAGAVQGASEPLAVEAHKPPPRRAPASRHAEPTPAPEVEPEVEPPAAAAPARRRGFGRAAAADAEVPAPAPVAAPAATPRRSFARKQ